MGNQSSGTVVPYNEEDIHGLEGADGKFNEERFRTLMKSKAEEQAQDGDGPRSVDAQEHLVKLNTTETLFKIFPYVGVGDEHTDNIVMGILNSRAFHVETRDEFGNTLLLIATQHRNEALVRMLLDHCKSRCDAQNSTGAAALHFSCAAGTFSLSITRALLEAGAPTITVESTYGCSPLHYAASCPSAALVTILLEHGANPLAQDSDGYIPEDYATEAGLDENIALLLAAGEAARNAPPGSPSKDWQLHVDPDSGYSYLYNPKTGERKWKSDADADGSLGAASPVKASFADVVATAAPMVAAAAAIGDSGDDDEGDDEDEGEQLSLTLPAAAAVNVAGPMQRLPPSIAVLEQAAQQRRVAAVLGEVGLDLTGDETNSDDDGSSMLSVLASELARAEQAAGAGGSLLDGEAIATSAPVLQLWLGAAFSLGAREVAQRASTRVRSLARKLARAESTASTEAEKRFAESQAAQGQASDAVDEVLQKLEASQKEAAAVRATLAERQSTVERLGDELRSERRQREEMAGEQARIIGERTSEVTAQAKSSIERAQAEAKRIVEKTRSDAEAQVTQFNQRWLKERTLRRKYFNELETMKGKIRVYCRVRPMNGSERERQCASAVTVTDDSSLEIISSAGKKHEFEFDRVFKLGDSQSDVFKDTALLLQSVLDGFNVCIFAYVFRLPLHPPHQLASHLVWRDRTLLAAHNFSSPVSFSLPPSLHISLVSTRNRYGQTGSGKTFTMMGEGTIDWDQIGAQLQAETDRTAAEGSATAGGEDPSGAGRVNLDEHNPMLGLSPRATVELFRLMARDADKFEFKVKLSVYELYRDELVDLLYSGKKKNRPKLVVKQDSGGRVTVEGAVITDVATAAELQVRVQSDFAPLFVSSYSGCSLVFLFRSFPFAFAPGDVQSKLVNCMSRRHTASTKMNAESSRSHLVQQIFVEATNKANGAVMIGKLTLVDLAGSERMAKTGATGDTAKEAQSINRSLSALGNVISALSTKSAHVPYRDAMLTQLMRDCLGGNAKTLMFVNISPAVRRVGVALAWRWLACACLPARTPLRRMLTAALSCFVPAFSIAAQSKQTGLQCIRNPYEPRFRAALQEGVEQGVCGDGKQADAPPQDAAREDAGWWWGGW